MLITFKGVLAPIYTSLLLHMDGADTGVVFTDSAFVPKAVSAGGHAQTLTAEKKFGTAAAHFDNGGDDYLSTPESENAGFNFYNLDFTVDMWVYIHAFGSNNTFCMQGTIASRGWALQLVSDDYLKFYYTTNGRSDLGVQAAKAFVINTWYHIAVSRTGGKIYLFVDGVLLNAGGTAFTDSIYAPNKPFYVGRFGDYTDGNYSANGLIDELRVTKGLARWTADFSGALPAAAYDPD